MAGRDATITIFHLGRMIAAVRGSLNQIPSIQADVDSKRLREVEKRFRREFPNFEMMRHGVGHRAEAVASLAKLKSHLKDKAFVFGRIDGRVYTITFGNEHHSLVVDRQRSKLLAEIVNDVFSSFPQLVKNLPVATA